MAKKTKKKRTARKAETKQAYAHISFDVGRTPFDKYDSALAQEEVQHNMTQFLRQLDCRICGFPEPTYIPFHPPVYGPPPRQKVGAALRNTMKHVAQQETYDCDCDPDY